MKKRIAISLLFLSISLSICSLSFSLAWYVASANLYIEEMNITFNSEANLYISPYIDRGFKDKYSSIDDKDDIEQVNVFLPTSSMYSSIWMNEKNPNPKFYDCTNPSMMIGEDNLQEMNYGFYSQKLYLLADRDYYIGIDTTQTYFSSLEIENKARAKELHDKYPNVDEDYIYEKLNSLIKALRFSILVNSDEHYSYYIIDVDKDEKTYLGGLLDNNNDGYFDTYEDYVDNQLVNKEVIFGEFNDKDKIIYDEPTAKYDEELEKKDHILGNCFLGESRKSAYTYNSTKSLENGFYIKEENSYSLLELEDTHSPVVVPCYKNKPTEIVFSIYLEGWDKDCFNTTMGAYFSGQIAFKYLRGID